MHKNDGDLITYRGHSLTADFFTRGAIPSPPDPEEAEDDSDNETVTETAELTVHDPID